MIKKKNDWTEYLWILWFLNEVLILAFKGVQLKYILIIKKNC